MLRTRDQPFPPLLCYSFLSPHRYRKCSGCMSVARESIFPSCIFLFLFVLFFFFLTHSPVKFPRQTDNTDGSLRKSLVRAKAKSDDLSLSPKATSKNFLFTFYTYKESLSLSYTHARTHSRTHPHTHFLPLIFSRTSVPTFATNRSNWLKESVIGFSIYVKRLYSCVKSNPKD